MMPSGSEYHFHEISHSHSHSNITQHHSSNDTDERCQTLWESCSPGLILPLWLPIALNDPEASAYRAIVYLAALAYVLFGVGVITDRIVACTEIMAAQKRVKTIQRRNGTTRIVQVKIWHPVVAALTFGVIGTSAPEILLPVIQTFLRSFRNDDLGPSLIIGSGAYHLFIITAVCLFSARESSGKPIRDLHLFFTTTAFGICAYLWVYLLLDHISPGVIEIWEAAVLVVLFPLLVVSAWVVASRFPSELLERLAHAIRKRNAVSPSLSLTSTSSSIQSSEYSEETYEDRRRRKMTASRLKHLRRQHPEKNQLELEAMAQKEIFESAPKSSAFYRLQATKSITNTTKRMSIKNIIEESRSQTEVTQSFVQTIGFKSDRISCLESCKSLEIPIERCGAGVNETSLIVKYETVQGTAKPNVNYKPITNGQLVFEPGETKSAIVVSVMDDGIYEERAKFFTVKLNGSTLETAKSLMVPPVQKEASDEAVIREQQQLTAGEQRRHHHHRNHHSIKVEFATAETTVSILDDDHCGVFAFLKSDQAVPDNIGTANIKVVRSVGTKCRITVPYKITPGTARLNEDFFVPITEGVLLFDEGQFEQFIDIEIIDKNRYGDVFTFHIELFPPRKEIDPFSNRAASSTIGLPRLGTPNFIKIGICETEETRQALDRLLMTPEIPGHIVSSSYLRQLRDIFVIYRDDLPPRSCGWHYVAALIKLYCLHILAFPWKLIVAALPPTRLGHGYVAYFSLLVLIGVMAILIGDCATLFACNIGLKDTVTAITFIPIGMGLPDTFASRHAAMHEKTADAAIGGIVGSNAVSLFLGIGLSWTIGALYATSKGEKFTMPSSHFGFSVIIYCALVAVGIAVLLLRRLPPIRGELGGPNAVRYLTGCFFLLLWIVFVVLSILEKHCLMPSFLS